jgi:protein subunit release factor B
LNTLTKPYQPQFYFSNQQQQDGTDSETYTKEQVAAILKTLKPNSGDLDWKYVRGSGKGGQKVNKTTNCVILTYLPTGTQVKVHKSRELETNRNLALK